MQCPPTPAPGDNMSTLGCLFVNPINSLTSIPKLSQIIDNSFAKAIFTSLKLFSVNLASSVLSSVSNTFSETKHL